MKIAAFAFLAASAAVNAAIIWDGTFDNYPTSADFDKWSWANQVGAYQWYIHGSQPTSSYLIPGASYKNPAETDESRGLKLVVDGTSSWNGQSMKRTELIPQSNQNLGTGTLYYQFSFKRGATNGPTPSEHQIFFFESHFTEFKTGVGGAADDLHWYVGGQSRWKTTFTPDVWFNFAYEINFSSGSVGLWASTGGNPLTKVVQNVSASTSTNSADFHVGVLRLGDTATEEWYISGVFISTTIVTSIGSGTTPPPISTITTSTWTPPPPSSTSTTSTTSTRSSTTTSRSSTTTTRSSTTTTSRSSTTTTSSSSTPPTSTPPTSTTTTASGPLQTLYGQCGGQGWAGPTACAPPATCKDIAPPWYYQCLN